MPGGWKGSTRSRRLPRDWRSRRRPRVLERDGYRCTVVENGVRCTARAVEVDHIDREGPEDDSNYASICGPHHAKKSAREGGLAGVRHRRPDEAHPGVI